MQGLGDVFGELFAQRGAERGMPPRPTRTFVKDMVIDEPKQLPANPPNEQSSHLLAQVTHPTTERPERERVLRIFNLEGETLELAENRLKAKSAADYYKRLTYLFIYAQEILLGRSSAPKSELIAVLKAAKVYDPNCSFWLKQKKGFTVDTEDRMKLIAGAKEQAVKALTEALDGDVADEWNPDQRTVKARGTRKKK